jgi:hypothetical protein
VMGVNVGATSREGHRLLPAIRSSNSAIAESLNAQTENSFWA